jgi:hypothetical protein
MKFIFHEAKKLSNMNKIFIIDFMLKSFNEIDNRNNFRFKCQRALLYFRNKIEQYRMLTEIKIMTFDILNIMSQYL